MFLTIIGGLIFGSQAWEWKTSSKGNTVLLKQRRKFTQFVDKEGNRVALAEFATTLPEERTTNKKKVNGLWMNQCLRIQLRKFKRVLKRIQNF
jgi:cytochrome c oxidase subunit 3